MIIYHTWIWNGRRFFVKIYNKLQEFKSFNLKQDWFFSQIWWQNALELVKVFTRNDETKIALVWFPFQIPFLYVRKLICFIYIYVCGRFCSMCLHCHNDAVVLMYILYYRMLSTTVMLGIIQQKWQNHSSTLLTLLQPWLGYMFYSGRSL